MPGILERIISWSPSIALTKLFNASLLEKAPWGEAWANFGKVLLAAAPFYMLTSWKFSRQE